MHVVLERQSFESVTLLPGSRFGLCYRFSKIGGQNHPKPSSYGSKRHIRDQFVKIFVQRFAQENANGLGTSTRGAAAVPNGLSSEQALPRSSLCLGNSHGMPWLSANGQLNINSRSGCQVFSASYHSGAC